MTGLREAAQMALDALKKLNKDGWILADFEDEVCASIEALRAALATEQEPYCYTWDKWISGGNWQAQYGWEPYCGGKRPDHSTEAKPLYTAPPQREWQGLTDEEIEQGMKQAYSTVQGRNLEIAFARAIEAKLKEKNGG